MPMEIVKPSWVPDLNDYRPGVRHFRTFEQQTAVTRGIDAANVLLEKIFPTASGTVYVLDVGVGYQAQGIYCPYEPYTLAAALEGSGRDYKLDIVDRNLNILRDLRGRERIYLQMTHYRAGRYKSAWDRYLQNTNQPLLSSNSSEVGVKRAKNPFRDSLLQKDEVFEDLFYEASVPRSFRMKLTNGDIKLIHASIVDAPLGDHGRYHLAACTNVLYLLNQPGQKLALYNIASSLLEGGILVITDSANIGIPPGRTYEDYPGSALLENNGGWLSTGKLEDLGLVLDHVIESLPPNQTLAFRKV